MEGLLITDYQYSLDNRTRMIDWWTPGKYIDQIIIIYSFLFLQVRKE